MLAFVSRSSLDAHNESGSRVQAWELGYLNRIKDTQDVEFAFLRDIGGVGEERERNVHALK